MVTVTAFYPMVRTMTTVMDFTPMVITALVKLINIETIDATKHTRLLFSMAITPTMARPLQPWPPLPIHIHRL